MDNGAPQPKPKASARTTKSGAPTDPRTDGASTRRRTPSARVSSTTGRGTTSTPLLPSDSVIDDPLLAPVQEGTPIEIPRIIPAEVDDEPTVTSARTAPIDPIFLPAADPVVDYTSNLPRPPEFTDSDGTDGLPSVMRPKQPARPLRPVRVPRARRPRVRRVTRVVRTVDTWSVFKVALVFSLFLYAVVLTAGVLLWQVAQNTGTVDNVERFFESFGWQTFELKGGAIYHNAWVGGLFLVVGLTGLCVLTATMFNLIADLVGGIRVTVLEEEVVAREERTSTWMRRLRPGHDREPAEPVLGPTGDLTGDHDRPG